MDIQRIQARVAIVLPDGDAYASVDITNDGSGNFVAIVDHPDGQLIEDVAVELPGEVHEGLQAAIRRALTTSPEVGLDVTQVR